MISRERWAWEYPWLEYPGEVDVESAPHVRYWIEASEYARQVGAELQQPRPGICRHGPDSFCIEGRSVRRDTALPELATGNQVVKDFVAAQLKRTPARISRRGLIWLTEDSLDPHVNTVQNLMHEMCKDKMRYPENLRLPDPEELTQEHIDNLEWFAGQGRVYSGLRILNPCTQQARTKDGSFWCESEIVDWPRPTPLADKVSARGGEFVSRDEDGTVHFKLNGNEFSCHERHFEDENNPLPCLNEDKVGYALALDWCSANGGWPTPHPHWPDSYLPPSRGSAPFPRSQLETLHRLLTPGWPTCGLGFPGNGSSDGRGWLQFTALIQGNLGRDIMPGEDWDEIVREVVRNTRVGSTFSPERTAHPDWILNRFRAMDGWMKIPGMIVSDHGYMEVTDAQADLVRDQIREVTGADSICIDLDTGLHTVDGNRLKEGAPPASELDKGWRRSGEHTIETWSGSIYCADSLPDGAWDQENGWFIPPSSSEAATLSIPLEDLDLYTLLRDGSDPYWSGSCYRPGPITQLKDDEPDLAPETEQDEDMTEAISQNCPYCGSSETKIRYCKKTGAMKVTCSHCRYKGPLNLQVGEETVKLANGPRPSRLKSTAVGAAKALGWIITRPLIIVGSFVTGSAVGTENVVRFALDLCS